ncbi:hypothetical protein ACFC4S_28830 [Priestia megaterium]|uniref:hypothetical protein n=1 Tax=Priestia megaterium TaxID=1404 RepID=UPI0035D5C19E
MKRKRLLVLASSVVISLAACSSQTDEKAKVSGEVNKSNEVATVVSHKQASKEEQQLDNKAAQALIKLFKSVDKGNVDQVTKQVAFFNEINSSNKEEVNSLIKEWKDYDFLHNATLTPVLESDMSQETVDLYNGNGVTRVIVAMKYKGEGGNKFNKAFYLEEQEDGAFYLMEWTPLNNSASLKDVKPEARDKYNMRTSQANSSTRSNQSASADEDLSSDSNINGYVDDGTLGELMNMLFKKYPGELGTEIKYLTRIDDLSFKVETDKGDLKVVFQDNGEAVSWAVFKGINNEILHHSDGWEEDGTGNGKGSTTRIEEDESTKESSKKNDAVQRNDAKSVLKAAFAKIEADDAQGLQPLLIQEDNFKPATIQNAQDVIDEFKGYDLENKLSLKVVSMDDMSDKALEQMKNGVKGKVVIGTYDGVIPEEVDSGKHWFVSLIEQNGKLYLYDIGPIGEVADSDIAEVIRPESMSKYGFK